MEINIGEIIVDEEINLGNLELDVVKEYPQLEDIEITPSGVEQNFKSSMYGYDNVKVKAVASDTLNITPSEEQQQHIGLYGTVNVDKIPDEYTKTEGTLEITDNGEYDVKTYEKANVSIEKKEDLTIELTEQDNLITTQEVSIEDITEALKGKMAGDISHLIKNVEFEYYAMLEHTKDITLNLINATTLISMFGNVPIMFNKLSITISSKCTSFQNTFRATSVTDMNLKKLKIIEINGDTSNVITFINTFANRRDIEEIRGELNLISATTVSGMFTYCAVLKEVRFVPETIKLSISFAHSPELSDETVQSIINGLADMTGDETPTLTLNGNVKEKLTEEQIATITSKNWTLA